mmetsp:Transcript_23706/g.35111  ORF Transcript_23706/g.35111 Transcript_23706/m.35111 type:complete len:241 (-) Transcript_23706:5-727(-)
MVQDRQLHATVHHDRAHNIELKQIIAARETVAFDTLCKVVEKEGRSAVFERKPGVYYRDVTDEAVTRSYFQEGGRRLVGPPIDACPRTSSMASTAQPTSDSVSLSTMHRIIAGICLVLASGFWTVAVGFCSERAFETFANGSIVLLVCLSAHLAAHWAARNNGFKVRGSPTTFAHYLLGIASFLTYGMLYAGGYETFLKNWSAVFFGYFLSDNITIIIGWETIHPDFRFFYSVHHALATS